MMTSSADFFGNFGCGSTGMPRPLSVTVRKPSALSSTSMKVAWPGQRLVHGVVDDFGEQMMQRLFVGAADIHAGPAAHRLEAFEHLDIGRGIAGFGAAGARRRPSAARGPSVPRRRTGRQRLWFWQLISMVWTWFFMCCARDRAANRSALTMPRMGLKSDGRADRDSARGSAVPRDRAPLVRRQWPRKPVGAEGAG